MWSDMDDVFHGVTIAGPRAEVAERPESNDARVGLRDDEREALFGLRVEPTVAPGRRKFDLGIDRRRVPDDLIVDVQYLGQIPAGCVADCRHLATRRHRTHTIGS